MAMKRTFQPSRRKRINKQRSSRRAKGRKKLTVSDESTFKYA